MLNQTVSDAEIMAIHARIKDILDRGVNVTQADYLLQLAKEITKELKVK